MIRALVAFLVRLATGVRLVADATAPQTRRIYFANHSSHLDFVVIWASLPRRLRDHTRPVAAAEYWEKDPARRWIARHFFKAVLIPRDPKRMKSADPLGRMIAALEEGADLIVFPEGTRSYGSVARFKPGLFHLASKRPDLELMPVYLENLNRILPKGELIPLPLMGHIVYGDAVPVPQEGEGKPEFLERTRLAVIALSHGTLTASSPDDERS